MATILGSDFISAFQLYRVAWFRGRFGRYKTFVASLLGKHLLDSGVVNGIWSNIPVRDAIGPNVYDAKHKYILYDESWQTLDARTFNTNKTKEWGAFLRKNNLYLALPSVWPVDLRFKSFFVEMMFDLTQFGIPALLCRWGVDLGYVKDGTSFWVFNPKSHYGYYDHLYQPHHDGMLLEVLAQAQEYDALKKGSGNPNGRAILMHPPTLQPVLDSEPTYDVMSLEEYNLPNVKPSSKR